MGNVGEKVVKTQGDLEFVNIFYRNDTKVIQCFYDVYGNLVSINPGETGKFMIRRKALLNAGVVKRDVPFPAKEKDDGLVENNDSRPHPRRSGKSANK
jgi:hypothetical protein